MRQLTALRYVLPLREGGSMPAIVETEDGLFVVKFRGAGQGPLALVAELFVGEIARALALNVPELAVIALEPAFGRSEPDPEIRHLLQASIGENVGLRFLPEATSFDIAAGDVVSPATASTIVWLDAYAQNIDRTVRNPNLLLYRREPWVIDHGAALYFQHSGGALADRASSPFAMIRDHVLLPFASELPLAGELARAVLTPPLLGSIVNEAPLEWFSAPEAGDPAERRAGYLEYFLQRMRSADIFEAEAQRAYEAQL